MRFRFWRGFTDEVSFGIDPKRPVTYSDILQRRSLSGRDRAMGKLMRSGIFLAILFALAGATSPVEAQGQSCASGCVKSYNGCIAQCGGTRASMPWEPVAKDKLVKINDCVRSQCQNRSTPAKAIAASPLRARTSKGPKI